MFPIFSAASAHNSHMPRRLQPIPDAIQAKLVEARVARLATFGAAYSPHIVPVCFTYDGKVFYSAVDLKPKRVAPKKLARLQHIRARPQVALLIDQYDEDWSRLWYILVRGRANLIPNSAHKERAKALRQLKAKYPQYTVGMLPDDAPLIRITPERIVSWGAT
jgi:PPOX class probable F420-dependent enzyme